MSLEDPGDLSQFEPEFEMELQARTTGDKVPWWEAAVGSADTKEHG